MRVLTPLGDLGYFGCRDGPLDGTVVALRAESPPPLLRCQVGGAQALVGPEPVLVVSAYFIESGVTPTWPCPIHTYVRCPEGHYHHLGIEAGT